MIVDGACIWVFGNMVPRKVRLDMGILIYFAIHPYLVALVARAILLLKYKTLIKNRIDELILIRESIQYIAYSKSCAWAWFV